MVDYNYSRNAHKMVTDSIWAKAIQMPNVDTEIDPATIY